MNFSELDNSKIEILEITYPKISTEGWISKILFHSFFVECLGLELEPEPGVICSLAYQKPKENRSYSAMAYLV